MFVAASLIAGYERLGYGRRRRGESFRGRERLVQWPNCVYEHTAEVFVIDNEHSILGWIGMGSASTASFDVS